MRPRLKTRRAGNREGIGDALISFSEPLCPQYPLRGKPSLPTIEERDVVPHAVFRLSRRGRAVEF